MKSKVIQAINKKLRKEDDSYAVIGIELKNRRVTLSRTLGAIAYKICSVSYLSKIENNKIIPNNIFVREICSKLDLSSDKIEILLNLKEILQDCVRLFLSEDFDKIKKQCDDGAGLNNYRYKLISFIYHISILDLYKANEIYNSIIPLVSSMPMIDLVVLGVFSGILHYHNHEFNEAIEELLSLRDMESFKELKIIRDIYIFYCYCAQNRYDTLNEYNNLVDILLKNGQYEKLDYIHYIMGINYVYNKCDKALSNVLIQIRSIKYKMTLTFLKKFFNKEFIKVNDFSNKNLSKFAYYLKQIIVNKEDVFKEIEKLDILIYSIDSNNLLLKYLLIDNPTEKLNYIDDIIIPKLIKSKELFWTEYFINEYSILSKKVGRYKCFLEAYFQIKQ